MIPSPFVVAAAPMKTKTASHLPSIALFCLDSTAYMGRCTVAADGQWASSPAKVSALGVRQTNRRSTRFQLFDQLLLASPPSSIRPVLQPTSPQRKSNGPPHQLVKSPGCTTQANTEHLGARNQKRCRQSANRSRLHQSDRSCS